MTFPYRLALDLGTTSIGWCVLRLDDITNKPKAVVRGGVRIFGDGRDPKSKESLAKDRRLARGMRRNRDRRLARKGRLIDALVAAGLMPADKSERRALELLDPYELRARGLDEALTPYEFGRALFHLNQRRGFKSNRKTDRAESDSSVMKSAISTTRHHVEAGGWRTVGEWLADRHRRGQPTRARIHGSSSTDRAYDLYIDRQMIREEFDALWQTQATFDPARYSDDLYEAIVGVLFFQRPLRPVPVGRCTLDPTVERAPLALPSTQRFRILQEVNNLQVEDGPYTRRPLTEDERETVAEELGKRRKYSFDQIRKRLKLEDQPRFNLESEKRKDLKGDVVAAELAHKSGFGADWHQFSLAEQDVIVARLMEEESEEKLVRWLQEQYGLSDQAAEYVAGARLPDGHARLGQSTIARILPFLEQGDLYNTAVEHAGFASHSDLSHTRATGEFFGHLPYYGVPLQRHVGFGSGDPEDPDDRRYGRIANPTVHIALNEVRKVVNCIIDDYGSPSEVVVEVTRELKLSKERKREIDKLQAENQKRNDRWRELLRPILGREPTRIDLQKQQLWEELDYNDPLNRRCPFTGEQISLERLHRPGSDVEIEHILPYARTLDNSMANKTVSLRQANRDKGNRTPYEAFGHNPPGYNYDAILARASRMKKNKRFRFLPDGLEQWERGSDFLARALNDTSYLARMAREYLECVTPPNQVWSVPGQLTARFRHEYGLNGLLDEGEQKNRHDHRHHAIDAAVIGVIDRSNLQKYATAQARGVELEERPDVPEPWPHYRLHVKRMVEQITVSHRPNHSYQRQMNNDTIYGLRPDGMVVVRKPLSSIKSLGQLRKLNIVDRHLADRLLAATGDAVTDGEFSLLLARFIEESGVKRVRVQEKLDVIPIGFPERADHRRPRPGRGSPDGAYRGVKGDSNYCIEIYIDDKGRWRGEVISTFQAYQIVRTEGEGRLRDPHWTLSGKPLVMRLMRDDTVQMLVDGERRLMRVCVVKGTGEMHWAGTAESNVDARHRDRNDGFKYTIKSPGSLQAALARKVTVSPHGVKKIHR